MSGHEHLNLFLPYSVHILAISVKTGIEVTLSDVSRRASKVKRASDEEEIGSVCSSTAYSSTAPSASSTESAMPVVLIITSKWMTRCLALVAILAQVKRAWL